MIEALFWFIFGGLSFVTVLFVWVACVVAGDTDERYEEEARKKHEHTD